jgi:hypothetical protein
MQRQVRIVALLGSLLAACASAPPPRCDERAGYRRTAPEYAAAAVVVGASRVDSLAWLVVTVETRGGFHLNDEYPHRFTPLPAPTISYDEALIDAAAMKRHACRTEGSRACALEVAVPFVARAAGHATVGGELAFGACDADRCIIEKLPVAVPLDVEPANPGVGIDGLNYRR